MFILFGVALVGGLGGIYYTLPVVISGLAMICAGITAILKKNKKITFSLLRISFITYMPFFIKQFACIKEIDWLSVFSNAILLMLIGMLAIYFKPNKAFNSQPPAAGTPQSGAH